MKLLIGLVGYGTGENSFGIGKAYINWAQQFGNVITLNPMDEIVEGLDLLIIPGGPDVSPASYGAVPGMYTGKTCPFRQYFLEHNFPQYVDAGIPIVGTCAAFQGILSMHFDCEMTQHCAFKYSTKGRGEEVDLLMPPNWNRKRLTEKEAKKMSICGINSIHHQGIFPKQLSPNFHENFDIVGISYNEGNVEVVQHKKYPMLLMQHHAEELSGPSATFFNNLVKSLL